MFESAEFYIQHLNLLPHPEGGYYREVYRSEVCLPALALPKGFTGMRQICTSIYFLIEKQNFSAFHRIKSDEIWHFYGGDALEVIELRNDGSLKKTTLGRNLQSGERLQYTVKGHTWFASRVKTTGEFSLVACTVAPGFDFADFEIADRKKLIQDFPQHKLEILALTRI